MPENTKIPFFRPPKLEPDEILYIESLIDMIVDSGTLTNGPFCRELEDMVKGIYNVDYAFTTTSGTAGLWIALRVLKPKTVALPSFTWKSLLYLVEGYDVKWLDIDRKTWLPEITKFEEATYIINYTFGNVGEFSFPKGSRVIFDAAHAFGARIPEFGDITVFSLAPTKPFTSCEGGVIVTNDSSLARKIEEVRDKCARMSEVHAVIGQIFLGKLGSVLTRRRKIWEYYSRRLPYKPQKIAYSTSYSVYGMLVPPNERVQLVSRIEDKMEYKIYYEPLVRGLKNTEYVYNRILCIPSYNHVDEEKVVRICLGK